MLHLFLLESCITSRQNYHVNNCQLKKNILQGDIVKRYCFIANLHVFVGGRLVYLYTKKQGTVPKCGDCKNKLQGVCTYLQQCCDTDPLSERIVQRVYYFRTSLKIIPNRTLLGRHLRN